MDTSPLPQNRLNIAITKIMAGISATLGAMWALITYVFPDPSVFGFGFVNWKNLILLISVFLFLAALSIGWQARRLPDAMKGTLSLILAALLAGGFFTLGSEYAKPTFEFAQSQKLIVENDGANLFGKRIELVDGVRIELVECEQIGQAPSCVLELTNTNVDRDLRGISNSTLFEKTGGSLDIDQLQVGQTKIKSWNDFPLVRNVPTRITLIFQPVRGKLESIPALKVKFRSLKGEDNVVKFSDVAVN
ncbi:hypothetical protein [Pseudomonas sp. ICMP 460]|uniref:hypothetical protein n=1 Tax=Pseudomonas sp. ICMP 460 TaxID=1718917 RepID=UPI0021159EB6|nr:hypothetical protein [Pseudomonas sp. ICMP 460]